MAEPFDTWAREEREARIRKAKVMTAWTVGWIIRHLAMGFLLGLGAWLGFAVVGTKIVCQ